ncbi:unnamed protein product [Orchesella dallaii]|uniref:Uncharacterized protein n=1 Tax=Orchesella dallaii TaxID=48710 RepID=A0ABP1RY48_9HEXA
MLTETYIDEAERCSQLGCQTYEGPHSNTLVTSIFQMYQTHMKMRLERVEKSSKEEGLGSRFLRFVLQTKSQYDAIKDAHMYHALELLFPEDTDQFKHLLTSNSSLELGELCKYGILETTATDSTSSEIRFVHRTFAEYLVAWFLVEDENARCTSPEFKISRILSTHKAPKWKIEIPLLDPSEEPDFRNFLQHFRFDLPVVCYFINELTKTETEADAQLPQVSSLLYSTVYPHIAPVVCASAYHNHPHLLLAVYNFLPLPGEKTDNNQNEDMSSLLLIASNFADIELMKGGLLGSEVEENPWKFESVQNDMDKIIKSTEITDEFLNQEEIRNLLTEGELKTIQVSTGLDRSENFFKILKEKPDSFEIFFKNFISTSMNQVVAFETVRGSLSKHLGAHEIGAIINPRA